MSHGVSTDQQSSKSSSTEQKISKEGAKETLKLSSEKPSSNEDQSHAARSIESVLSSLKDALNAAQYFSIDSEEDEDNGSVAIYGKNIMHSNKKNTLTKTILILNSRTSKQAKPQGKESMLQHYLNITVHRNENSMVEASPTINEANYTSDSQSDSIVV